MSGSTVDITSSSFPRAGHNPVFITVIKFAFCTIYPNIITSANDVFTSGFMIFVLALSAKLFRVIFRSSARGDSVFIVYAVAWSFSYQSNSILICFHYKQISLFTQLH